MNVEVVFGEVVLDKNRYFLEVDKKKYSIHSTNIEEIKGLSKVGGVIFTYTEDLAKFMGFDGYVYPGTICKVGDGEPKEHSS